MYDIAVIGKGPAGISAAVNAKDVPVKFEGAMQARKLVLKNSVVEADGFFVLKDSYPLAALVPGVNVDGPHVVINKHMETNIPGLYAAGDVTGKPYQIAKTVGEGQLAIFNAVEYLSKKLLTPPPYI